MFNNQGKKRQYTQNEEEEQKEFFEIQFLLHDIKETPHISEFDGQYKGECLVTMCIQKKEIIGKTFRIHARNISSYSTCFKYYAKNAYFDKNGGIVIGKEEYVMAIDEKQKFTVDDVGLIFTEMIRFKKSLQFKLAKCEITEIIKKQGYAIRFNIDKLIAITPYLNQVSDLNRLRHIQKISRLFTKPKQRVIIRNFSFVQLVEMVRVIDTEPWLLLFKLYTKPRFLKLKPITMKTYEMQTQKMAIPPNMRIAITIYRLYTEDSVESNDTVFNYSTHWMRLARSNLEVMEFLQKWAFTWFDLQKTKFALKQDMEEAKIVFLFLLRCQKMATKRVPQVRGSIVPVIPQELTADQCKVAQHIIENAVTIVEGGPGVGKTSIISWAMSHFKNVLLCTLTGMMTKSLQSRCGNRKECAHTIHKLVYAGYNPHGKAWLSQFELLIIDEFSNTPTNVLSKLVRLLSGVVKVVLVGDYNQLPSMKKGDPLGDIRRFFPPLILTEILRVSPHLYDLATAPKKIVNGQCKEISFSEKGSLTFVTKNHHHSYYETLKPIWRQVANDSLLSFHIVCITNRVRHSINEQSQKLLIEFGTLRRPHATIRFGNHEFFPGTKITFSKNYNREIVYKDNYVSQSVSNGELAILHSIQRIGTGIYYMKIVTDCGEEKTVIVSRKVDGAIDQNHVDLGYASTTTKVQGKEFPKVAYWHSTHPQLVWSRAHPYVAISRGKQKSWVICLERREFDTICSTVEKKRKTILCTIMQTHEKELYEYTGKCKKGPDMMSLKSLSLMKKDTPCLPIYNPDPEAIPTIEDDDDD